MSIFPRWRIGLVIEIVDKYCYLGITFSSTGNFKNAIDNLIDKAMRAFFKIRQYNIRDDVSVAFKLFNTLVAPIYRYGWKVWAPFKLKSLTPDNLLVLCEKCPIEKINNKFCKYLLGLHKYSSNLTSKGELGSHGLLLDCISHSIKFWLRLCNDDMDQDSLVYKSYKENYQNFISHPKSDNWCHHINNILVNFNLSSLWIDQGLKTNVSQKSWIKFLRTELKSRYELDWMKAVNLNDGKLRTFKLFKNKFGLENYLLFGKFNERKYFSKLRTSSHILHIEAGRHKRPPTPSDLRFCLSCNNGSVENELHFLLHCNRYDIIRKKLFDNLSSFVDLKQFPDDHELFLFLMTCNSGDYEITKEVLNFVKLAYDQRIS